MATTEMACSTPSACLMDGLSGMVTAVTPSVRVAYEVLTHRRQIYYGWWMLAGSVLAVAAASGLSFWSLGLYVRPLEDEFGWSRAEVSLGFSLSFLTAGLVAPLIGRWIDVRGPRQVILVGALLTAATYVLLATTNALWQWFLYQSINAVFRQMMFFIPFQALISRWFSQRRGLAVGILGMGFSLGGFAVIPVMRVIIDAVGWEGSFVVAGAVIAAIFIPMNLFLIRNSPGEVGQHVDGRPPRPLAHAMETDPPEITARQALRIPLFWILTLAIGFFIAGLVAWLVHAVPFFESRGISPGWAAGIVSITAGFSMFARIAFGLVADRVARIELLAVVLTVTLSVALVAMLVSTAAGMIYRIRRAVGRGLERRSDVRAVASHPGIRGDALRHDPRRRGRGGNDWRGADPNSCGHHLRLHRILRLGAGAAERPVRHCRPPVLRRIPAAAPHRPGAGHRVALDSTQYVRASAKQAYARSKHRSSGSSLVDSRSSTLIKC